MKGRREIWEDVKKGQQPNVLNDGPTDEHEFVHALENPHRDLDRIFHEEHMARTVGEKAKQLRNYPAGEVGKEDGYLFGLRRAGVWGRATGGADDGPGAADRGAVARRRDVMMNKDEKLVGRWELEDADGRRLVFEQDADGGLGATSAPLKEEVARARAIGTARLFQLGEVAVPPRAALTLEQAVFVLGNVAVLPREWVDAAIPPMGRMEGDGKDLGEVVS